MKLTTPNDLVFEPTTQEITAVVVDLYRRGAQSPDGLVRRVDEIDPDYVKAFIKRCQRRGLAIVARVDRQVIGEIHAHTPEVYAFRHLLTDLTIVIDPDWQGQGVGRRLFQYYLNRVTETLPHIHRIELFTRSHNHRTIAFYESLGFINEGPQRNKILKTEGQYETPVHMAWFRM